MRKYREMTIYVYILAIRWSDNVESKRYDNCTSVQSAYIQKEKAWEMWKNAQSMRGREKMWNKK